ncbi:MAG: hypothetical protein JW795_15745, partial [Chitinivibrionales bacterium]|nr:hypothetical protein [Chitinivibrionales bacterium]
SAPVPICASKAFDAWADQIDPSTETPAHVALVDVRSFSEYFWIGGAAKTDKIILTSGIEIVPDKGKTVFNCAGGILRLHVNGYPKCISLRKIKALQNSPISLNIPYKKWDEATKSLILNDQFVSQIEGLANTYDVLILFCKSGGRSGECASLFNMSLFKAVYEIDQPDGTNEMGGFEGNNYSDAFNGYRGYPLRQTQLRPTPSVSWKDEGLPIHIGWK